MATRETEETVSLAEAARKYGIPEREVRLCLKGATMPLDRLTNQPRVFKSDLGKVERWARAFTPLDGAYSCEEVARMYGLSTDDVAQALRHSSVALHPETGEALVYGCDLSVVRGYAHQIERLRTKRLAAR